MLNIASEIYFCLFIALILGFLIGYFLAKDSCNSNLTHH